MEFEIVKMNIAEIAAEAIVLPANSSLREGPGASQAIFEAAGREALTKACKEIGRCEVGSAVPTPGFHLKARYVIHTVVPKWQGGNAGEYELLGRAYFSALLVADIMDCKSIALPLLGSGNNGFDLSLAFEIARESIECFEAHHLEKILLVIYGNKVASLVKAQGYHFVEIPEGLFEADAGKNAQPKVGSSLAQMLMEKALAKAKDFIGDPKNQEKIWTVASQVVKLAVEAKKNK